jgi:hypothetical protein
MFSEVFDAGLISFPRVGEECISEYVKELAMQSEELKDVETR